MPPTDGERKTVTALFADIKGSTALEEGLDPEDARRIIDPALKLMIDAARRYDGYVVQSTGDGIFALFGAPLAHEDHPNRALYAALRMQDDLKRYSTRLREAGNAPLEMRVGAHTGEVVVRSIKTGETHTEYTAIGHTTNLASRMQVMAPTGSVAISEDTRRLVEGYFALKAMGPTRVKGVTEPVNVYEVTGIGPLKTRLQRSAGRGYTKFVGRQRDLDAMKAAAEQAKIGRGQIVAAIAEPGVGKSRLLYEFKASSQLGWKVLEAVSVSHGKASSYFPVIDLLRGYFKIAGDDDQRTRREKVAGKIAILDRALEDTLPYLYGLLGIAEQPDPLAQMDTQIRKRRTLDALKRILLRESLNQPLMVIFEDLHWIDDETQALLNLLADSIGTSKILLLVNYRPEYSHGWGSKTYYTQLRLDPLGKATADEMLSDLLGDGKDLVPLKRLIIEKTEGNPLFMEETVQVLLDEGTLVRNGSVRLTKSLRDLKIPPTVQAILASRIDRLPPAEKGLLQTLAVIGREFAFSIVREVSGTQDLEAMLDHLQLAEFIYEQPAAGDLEYIFKHALTQQVALESVLVERRKLLHARAGVAIEKLFAERLDDHLVQLAHHYSRSGNSEKALDYLERAGQQAEQRSTYAEALKHYGAAIDLLKALPESPERDRRELRLLLAMGPLLLSTKGYGAREPESAYLRAAELCDRVGDTKAFLRVELGLITIYSIRGQVRSGLQRAKHLLELSADDPELLYKAHETMGRYTFWTGDLEASQAYFERALALLESLRCARLAPGVGTATESECWTYGAWTLWYQGYPEQALQVSRRALASAREQPDSWFFPGALSHAARLHIMRREPQIVAELAQESSEIAVARADASFIGESPMILGWAMVHGGDEVKGIEVFEQGLAAELAIMDTGWYFGGWPAEAYMMAGRIDKGLSWIADLFKPDENYVFEAELHRLKGELLLMKDSSSAPEAEQCFKSALDAAKRIGAKSLELRAATSLARLLTKQDRRDAARSILSEIYNWFTEGFDTADLKDAKSLLDELS